MSNEPILEAASLDIFAITPNLLYKKSKEQVRSDLKHLKSRLLKSVL